jgi:hypothetical protein
MSSNKIKCISCNKKFLKIICEIHTCRCGSVCCSDHMHDHNCPVDYVELNRKQQEQSLITVVNDKIKKI